MQHLTDTLQKLSETLIFFIFFVNFFDLFLAFFNDWDHVFFSVDFDVFNDGGWLNSHVQFWGDFVAFFFAFVSWCCFSGFFNAFFGGGHFWFFGGFNWFVDAFGFSWGGLWFWNFGGFDWVFAFFGLSWSCWGFS